MTTETNQSAPAIKSSVTVKLTVLAAIVCMAAIAYSQFGSVLSLTRLASLESQLREFQHAHPILVYGVAFLVYVLITGLSLPGATVLTLLYGWYFGFVIGLFVVSFSSTAGATLAFLLTRFLFRDPIQKRFGERLESFNRALEREGSLFLFSLRLIPAVPFFVINAVMGLTPIRMGTFWWVSQLGMLPGTAVYVYAGSSVPSLHTLADRGIGAVFTPNQLTQILIAFVALGIFPLILRGIMPIFSRSNPQPPAMP